MIKAIANVNGRPTVMLGLSFRNLDKFRDEPGDTFIPIDGTEMGLSFDIMIFSGETEAHLQDTIQGAIGPHTKIHIDPKLKS